MQTHSKRKKQPKALFQSGPLKVIHFVNPSGEKVFRVTGTVVGTRIQQNYSDAQEARVEMEKILKALTGLNQGEAPPSNLVRTSLSDDQIRIAEEIFRRARQSDQGVLELYNRGELAVQRETTRNDVKAYLIESLRGLGFGVEPERLKKETDKDFAARREICAKENKILNEWTEAQLAVVHYVRVSQKRGVQPNTAESYRYILLKFVRTAKITVVSQFSLDSARSFIMRQSVSQSTKKDQRGRLFGFFAHLESEKLINTNPLRAKMRFKAEAVEVVFVKLDTMETALRAFATWLPRCGAKHLFSRSQMLPRFLLFCYSGMRPGEIGRLKADWSDFNFEVGKVQIVRRKTGKQNGTISLDPRMAPILRHCKEIGLRPNFYRRAVWVNWLQECGVPHGVRDVLRHSFATYTFAVSHNYHELAYTMDNSLEVLRRHYVNIEPTRDQGEKYYAMLDKVLGYMEIPELTLEQRSRERAAKDVPQPLA